MDTLSGAPPWTRFKLFKRSSVDGNIPDIYELGYKEINEVQLDDEKLIHEFRGKISEYENKLNGDLNWEYFKKVINPYELVYTQKKYSKFPESLCMFHPLSRSYFKMVEMLDLINFFGEVKNESLRTAHVCEGPGGFIEALYDNAINNKKSIHSSYAMTLRSKQVNIPGWKRATHFLQKNRNIQIMYGEDDTGDILKPENQQYFIDSVKVKVNIFTGDGGFDFSCDYSKQEEMIFPLLIASVRIGFEVLKNGGVFILKIFDFYKKSTTDLIYFMSSYFKEWTLYKPATSRPCNPEHYFIGKGFVGYDEKTFDILRLWSNICLTTPIKTLYRAEYTDEFCKIMESFRINSFNSQTTYLKNIFHLIDDSIISDNSEIIKKYLNYNQITSYNWCKRFKVPIYQRRSREVEELQTCLQASCQ